MKLTILYDNHKQTVEVDKNEMKMWLKIDIEDIAEEDEDEVISKKFNEVFNKPEYNNCRKFYNHIDYNARCGRLDGKRGKIFFADNDEDEISEPNIDTFPDNSSNDERDRKLEDEEFKSEIRKKLQADQAELLIAVYIDKIPKQDYAAQLGISPSALSHRLATAEKNLKNFFS